MLYPYHDMSMIYICQFALKLYHLIVWKNFFVPDKNIYASVTLLFTAQTVIVDRNVDIMHLLI